MSATLDELLRGGILSPLDLHLGRLLARLCPGTDPRVVVAAALSSRAVRQGHVCVDLELLCRSPLLSEGGSDGPRAFDLPPLTDWLESLAASALVQTEREADPEAPRPLVLRGARLYLARYHRYETQLGRALLERASRLPAVDLAALRDTVGRLFPGSPGGEDHQRLAVVLAALRSLLVVSGGPGTGKTYTVTKLLAALVEQARAMGAAVPRILLLAPTGKAAQRLAESIGRNAEALPCAPEVLAAIPRSASTLHRALGALPSAPTRFRHDADNPLPADVVLVDEASMVDVALLAKLVRAVPETARLVLVGDKNQLASVEAGSILGDIYGDLPDGSLPAYSAGVLEAVHAVTGERLRVAERPQGIADCRVHLTESRRYAPDSGIARLAAAINQGDVPGALRALSSDDAQLLPSPPPRALEAALGDALRFVFGAFRRASAEERLARVDQLRILCVHRRGPYGVETVNRWAEHYLHEAGLKEEGSDLYDGRPILVTENDAQLQLYNGDVGVLCRAEDGALEACFTSPLGIRRVSPARLPAHESVFAMTVHKSQGSEFDRVLVLLPPEASPLLTRELLYTAVTRARSRVELYGTEAVLSAGIEARISRSSGLSELLRGEGEVR